MVNKTKELWQNELKNMDKAPSLASLAQMMRQMHASQGEILDQLSAMEQHNAERDRKIETLYKAFPSGDTDAHRRYHQIQIEILEEKRRLRQAIVEKTISGLIWAALVGGVSVGWKHFVQFLATLIKG